MRERLVVACLVWFVAMAGIALAAGGGALWIPIALGPFAVTAGVAFITTLVADVRAGLFRRQPWRERRRAFLRRSDPPGWVTWNLIWVTLVGAGCYVGVTDSSSRRAAATGVAIGFAMAGVTVKIIDYTLGIRNRDELEPEPNAERAAAPAATESDRFGL